MHLRGRDTRRMLRFGRCALDVAGRRFVSEAALATRIKEIRRATGDDGVVQGVVRTVRGRGYSLVVEPAQDGDDERPPSSGLLGRERDVSEALARRCLHERRRRRGARPIDESRG